LLFSIQQNLLAFFKFSHCRGGRAFNGRECLIISLLMLHARARVRAFNSVVKIKMRM